MGGTIGVGQHARGVAHGLGYGLRALVVHLLASDHRHTLRGFQQGSAGLGGDLTVSGVVAFHAAQCVTQGKPLDVGGWQIQCCVFGLRPQDVTAAVLADRL
ncbi:hypothetical protein D3C76_1377620 [compost metagenome]